MQSFDWPIIVAGMVKIAVVGGSFDPITNGHLTMCSEIICSKIVDEVWLVPCGPRPDKALIADPMSRYVMANLAVESTFDSTFPIRVNPIELQGRLPTYELNKELHAMYPHHTFLMVIGADLVPNLSSWHESGKLLETTKFLVVPRPGYDGVCSRFDCIAPEYRSNFTALPTHENSVSMCISSSEVRRRYTDGRNLVQGLVPRSVLAYMEREGIYDPVSSRKGEKRKDQAYPSAEEVGRAEKKTKQNEVDEAGVTGCSRETVHGGRTSKL